MKKKIETFTFYRRCHFCGEINRQKEASVEKCSFCEKDFIPFFYFDEQKALVLSDLTLRSEYPSDEILSLQGLTAFWENK